MEMKNESNDLSRNPNGGNYMQQAKQLRADTITGFVRQTTKKLKAWKAHKSIFRDDSKQYEMSATDKSCH